MAADFLDSNVVLYVASSDAGKAARARSLLGSGCVASVQVMNEVANVARRKMGLDWPDTRALLETLRALLDVRPITLDTHKTGLAYAERFGLSVYDGLIVAAATEAGSTTLWSEDMHDGLLVDGHLRISNPFIRHP